MTDEHGSPTRSAPLRVLPVVTPRRKTAADLYEIAFAQIDAARAQSRVEMAESEARVAKLKLAAELERNGRQKEADKLLAEVERDQRRAGIDVVERKIESHIADPKETA